MGLKYPRGFKPGMVVAHFKRELKKDPGMFGLYYILGFGKNLTNGQEGTVVIYLPLDDNSSRLTFVRSLEEFCSEVDRTKYPYIEQTYRFEIYADSIEDIDGGTL